MKKISLSLLAIIVIIGSISCKKEVSPELLVTVVDNNNSPVRNVWVKTSVPGAKFGILNDEVVDSAATDVFGIASFKYTNTVLLNLGLYANKNDTVLIDSAGVLLEVKRLSRGSSNVTEKKLVFR